MFYFIDSKLSCIQHWKLAIRKFEIERVESRINNIVSIDLRSMYPHLGFAREFFQRKKSQRYQRWLPTERQPEDRKKSRFLIRLSSFFAFSNARENGVIRFVIKKKFEKTFVHETNKFLTFAKKGNNDIRRLWTLAERYVTDLYSSIPAKPAFQLILFTFLDG